MVLHSGPHALERRGALSYDGRVANDTDGDDPRPRPAVDAAWAPVRPRTAPAAWEAAAAGPRSRTAAEHDGDASDSPSVEPVAPAHPSALERMLRRGGRGVRGVWRRASSARRLATGFATLGLVSALVVGAGVAAQPRYPVPVTTGALSADLRTAPSGDLWSTDLAALGATDLPDGCRGFRPLSEIDGDAVVASSAVAYDGCREAVALLARIDPSTGDVRWSIDLADLLGGRGIYLSMVRDDAGSLATVSSQEYLGARSVRIDLETGRVLGDVIGDDDSDDVVTQLMGVTSGRLLLASQPRDRVGPDGQSLTFTDGETTPYRLIDADHPDTVVWSGDVGTSETPYLAGAFLVVESENGPVLVDVETGEVHVVPGGIALVENVVQAGDLLVATVTTRAGEREALALDRAAERRWSAPLELDAQVVVAASCVIVESGRSDFRCLEPDDGRERWSRTLPVTEQDQAAVDVFQQGLETSSLVVDVTSQMRSATGDDAPTTILGLSPATGETTFSAEVPPFSYLTGLARTVGFAGSFVGQDFSKTVVTAFDLADGRRLWQQDSPPQGSLDFWGDTLVSVDADGVAHGLRTTADVVPATAEASR